MGGWGAFLGLEWLKVLRRHVWGRLEVYGGGKVGKVRNRGLVGAAQVGQVCRREEPLSY